MDPRYKSFLDLIAWSEGTSTSPITANDGYDVIVTGMDGPSVFTDYSKHPFEDGGSVTVRINPTLISTAAGRYQLLARYWRAYKVQLSLPDYSPASQDAVALQQMKERDALTYLEADNPQQAIERCATIWASFPTNDYGQGGKGMGDLLAKYWALMEA
jgi:muramidase (phage lysozyme)